jgi:hypothetical protein
MGKARDLLRGIGLLSSAGITVSNAGTRLLNIRNELNRLDKEGSAGRGKAFPEAAIRAATRAVPIARAAAVYAGEGAEKAPKKRAEQPLAEKRRKARLYMQRKRAKEKREGVPSAELERRRRANRVRMRRYRAERRR